MAFSFGGGGGSGNGSNPSVQDTQMGGGFSDTDPIGAVPDNPYLAAGITRGNTPQSWSFQAAPPPASLGASQQPFTSIQQQAYGINQVMPGATQAQATPSQAPNNMGVYRPEQAPPISSMPMPYGNNMTLVSGGGTPRPAEQQAPQQQYIPQVASNQPQYGQPFTPTPAPMQAPPPPPAQPYVPPTNLGGNSIAPSIASNQPGYGQPFNIGQVMPGRMANPMAQRFSQMPRGNIWQQLQNMRRR